MRLTALLALMPTLLAVATGAHQKVDGIKIYKCCPVYEKLAADGRSCVEAAWPRNSSVETDDRGVVTSSPLDSEWVGHWLPPGLPMQSIRSVVCDSFINSGVVTSINASSLWDSALLQNEDLWRNTITFFSIYTDYGAGGIARPKPKGGIRKAEYCVDAALPPLGPFAMRFKTECSYEECHRICCTQGKLMQNYEGRWKCVQDAHGNWMPNKSSLKKVFDPEFPYEENHYLFCDDLRLSLFEDRQVQWAHQDGSVRDFLFSSWVTCFEFYHSNGSLEKGLFYCEFPRNTRGFYRILRPLCVLSALLLLASLVSIVCNKSMRQKIHGRCLACHAACLLAFNIGQIVYYIAISDRLDAEGKDDIPPDIQIVCKYFALSLYFLLTAAWFWLTALCANMARGFRLHMSLLNKESRKLFLAISAFAWGLPALLTITCSILFTQPNEFKTPAWYVPSLMETRVCYIEPLFMSSDYFARVLFMKSGTTLFYYGPVCCLVVCNVICLAKTLQKVQYLKRGNSVLRREEDRIPLKQRHAEGTNPPKTHTGAGDGKAREGSKASGTIVDAKTIKLYIKIILMAGGVELLSEIIMWSTTDNNVNKIPFIQILVRFEYERNDSDLAYRAVGYVMDFFRAVVVTWLAAPEGGYLGPIMMGLRPDNRDNKRDRADNGGRWKQTVA